MTDVICHTNLDLFHEDWPTKLPAVPSVGDIIRSKTKHGDFQLTLQVVRVTWGYSEYYNNWIPEIELHMTEFQRKLPCSKGELSRGSITAFYEWYAPLVGKSVHNFI